MELRPHQVTSSQLLERSSRLYLADAMRVGKSGAAIVAARNLGLEKILIHCPAIAVQVWEEAWGSWWPGGPKPRIESYDKMIRNPAGYADYLGYDVYIPDEWHHCRNRQAARTKVSTAIANRTARVWPLSGTPMPNSPLDLYPALRAVWPDELRKVGVTSYAQYMDTFCDVFPGEYGPVVTGVKNTPVLQDILSRVMPLRRKLTDPEVAPWIPALQWENVTLDIGMDADDYRIKLIESGLSDRARAVLEYGEIPPHDGEMAKVRRELGTLKAPAAAKMIAAELADRDYDKIVVLAYHRDVLDVLEACLKPFGVVRVDGDTTDRNRRAGVEQFQLKPALRVFLGQITAVKESLNLSAANHVVFVEQDWLPDNNTQAASRIININKDSPTFARMLFAPGSVDSAVRAALRRRMLITDQIFTSNS